jgi:hypothetical protein
MLPLLGRTWPLWWAVAMMLGLRWHHVVVAGSQPDELDEVVFEAEETWGTLPERCTGNMQ